MASKVFMVVIAALFLAAVPAAVLADSGMSHNVTSYKGLNSYDKEALESAQSTNTVDADIWPISGPVATGAVPKVSSYFNMSHESLRYNPSFPDQRPISQNTGG